jgi:hypothetical protein
METKAFVSKSLGKQSWQTTFANKKTAGGGLRVINNGGSAGGLVTNHHATSFRGALAVPSAAAAGTGGRYDDRSGNHYHVTTVRLTSAVGTAVKARATATGYLDDHVGRSLFRGKRQGLRGAS